MNIFQRVKEESGNKIPVVVSLQSSIQLGQIALMK